MANKRMFTMKIVDSDAFLDMPLSTQCLYFHLNMRADDDGFIGNAKRIVRLIGANDDDLKLLIAKRFVLQFEDGVIVIKHWRMHNTLSSGRYHETQYLDEKSTLKLKQNGSYSLTDGDAINDTKQIEMGQRQVRRKKDEQETDSDIDIDLDLGKDLDSEKVKNKKKEKEVYFVDDVLNDAFLDYIEFRKKIKAPLTDRAKQLAINKLKELAGIPFSESMDNDLAVKILEQSIMNGWKGLFPLKDEKRKEASGQSNRVSMWQDIMEGLEDE